MASRHPPIPPETLEDASVDALVIGGGPAGAASARLLAERGHAVCLLTRDGSSAPTLVESLPPSCRKLLDAVGVRERIHQAGFVRTTGNTVRWGDGEERTERFADGAHGYQVVRRDFDRLLLELAAEAGATIRPDALVRRVEPLSDGRGWRATYRRPGRRTAGIQAPYVLDCSGRAGVLARRELRRVEPGQTTVAVSAVWARPDWGLPDPSDTLVESYEHGWAWSVPLSSSRRVVTVMIDPRLTPLRLHADLETAYRRELSQTRHLHALTRDARVEGPVRACDASPYGARHYAGPGFLLVGDAGSFIDPLSSFGVKKALASGWLAAVAVHTALRHPDRASAALTLHDRREREMYRRYRQETARQLAAAALDHGHPFWQHRAGEDETDASPVDVDRLRRDPAVRAAFDGLRRDPNGGIRLAIASRFRVVPAPAVHGHEIVLEEQLAVPPDLDGGESVRFLRGVDLLVLTRLAPERSRVPDLYELYNRTGPPVALPDFLGALSALIAWGVLRDTSGAAS